MAFSIPDGSRVYIQTAIAAPVTVSAVSNANPGVVTATAHGYSNNDEILMNSGWDDVNGSIYKISGVAANTFNLTGFDTSDTNFFPPGSGTGTAQKITTWTEITQITNIQTNGGDGQFAQLELLAKRNAISIPTRFNPTSIQLTIADDPSLAGYQAMVAASRTLQQRAFKIMMAGSGTYGYGYGYVLVNEMPQMNKGQVNTVTASIALLGRYLRY